MQSSIETKLTHFPKKCIVMDFDGTLVDSMKLFAEMWSYSFTKLKPEIDLIELNKVINECLGQSAEYTRAKMLKTFELEDRAEEAKKLRAEFRDFVDYKRYEIIGTRELLDELKTEQIPMIIHSNGDRHIIQPILEKLDYLKYFDEVVLGNEFGVLKPDPAMLLDLMRRKDYKPEDLVYWGDNEVDKQYAENAGVDYVVTNTSFPRKDLVSIFTSQK